MKHFIYLLISFCGVLVITSCYDNKEDNSVVITKDIPKVEIDNNLIGQVKTTASTLPTDVKIDFNGQVDFIDEKPYFFFKGKKVDKYFESIKVTSKNITYPFHLPMKENQTNYVDLIIPETIEDIAQDPAKSLTKSIGTSDLSIDPNSYTSGGVKITGTVNFKLSSIVYEAKGAYPGGVIVMDEEGKLSQLLPESFLFINAIDELQFEGKLNTERGQVYKYYPGLSVWRNVISVGLIDEAGLYAIGKDVPYITFETQLISADSSPIHGEEMLLKNAEISQQITTTNDGYIVGYLPQLSTINISPNNECNDEILMVETQSEAIVLSQQIIDIAEVNNYLLRGEIKDCNNQRLNESIISITLDNGALLLRAIDQDDFQINITSCQQIENIDIYADQQGGEESSQSLEYITSDTIDVYHLHVCNEIRGEYVSIKIEEEDKFLFAGSVDLINNQLLFNFTDDNDPNTKMIVRTRSMREGLFTDDDLNIIFQAPNLGQKGYDLQCGSSFSGCGFEKFIITDLGESKGDFVRGYYKGRFWVKTINPLQAGYKEMEGVFHIKREY